MAQTITEMNQYHKKKQLNQRYSTTQIQQTSIDLMANNRPQLSNVTPVIPITSIIFVT